MASRLCPYCKVVAQMTPVWGYTHTDERRTFRTRPGGSVNTALTKRGHVAATCGNCGSVNVAVIEGDAVNPEPGHPSTWLAALENTAWAKTWYPVAVTDHEFPDVPAHVARCAVEAYQCAEIGASMAALLMARATIEATAKAQGHATGSLFDKIDALEKARTIRPQLREAAHAVRILGNDMAHGDVEEMPTEQDVEDGLRLMTMILTEVFEAQAMTAGILSRHTKNPETPGES